MMTQQCRLCGQQVRAGYMPEHMAWHKRMERQALAKLPRDPKFSGYQVKRRTQALVHVEQGLLYVIRHLARR
jgi:hypothetical protein